jgi:purine nucleosidase/ribosylpyrimidine nucleosidase
LAPAAKVLEQHALAAKLHPGFASGVGTLVIMGGGHEVSNRTASAGPNRWRESEAAKVLLSAGFK